MHVRLEASLRPDLTAPDDAGLGEVDLPRKLRNLIASFYTDLSFQVKHDNFLSHAKSQDAGIRQGCPLPISVYIRDDCSISRHWHRTLQGPFRKQARPNQF